MKEINIFVIGEHRSLNARMKLNDLIINPHSKSFGVGEVVGAFLDIESEYYKSAFGETPVHVVDEFVMQQFINLIRNDKQYIELIEQHKNEVYDTYIFGIFRGKTFDVYKDYYMNAIAVTGLPIEKERIEIFTIDAAYFSFLNQLQQDAECRKQLNIMKNYVHINSKFFELFKKAI